MRKKKVKDAIHMVSAVRGFDLDDLILNEVNRLNLFFCPYHATR